MLNFRGGMQFCETSTKTAENLRQNDRAKRHKNRKQTESLSNPYTKKNDFTAVSKGFGQGFGRSGRGHRPAECRQAEEGASPGKTKEPANARSTFAGSGSSGYTRAAP